MNIQMILSALPNQLPAKHEAGAAPEHFALALDQASNGYRTGDSPLPAPLSGTAHGLPQTMAAHQALLQALHVNVDHQSGSENGRTDANAQLDEIMARLALIDGSFVQEQDADSVQVAMPQSDTDLKIASDVNAAHQLERQAADQAERQAAPLAVAAAPAPSGTGEMHMVNGNTASPTTAGQTATGQGQATQAAGQGQAAALPQAAMAVDRGFAVNADEAPLRTASSTTEFTTAFARTTQTGGELRAMTPDAPRAGFVPEATTMTQPVGTPPSQPQTAAQTTLPTQTSLSASVQSPNWPGQLGQQLVQFARLGGEQQVEMRLNPAELGPLSVTLKMTEQGAQAQFLASHAQVRQVLEQAIPQLREALAEQGITLGETSVGEQRRHDAQAFANQDGRQGQGGSATGEEEAALAAADEAATNATTTLSMDGRVNLYA